MGLGNRTVSVQSKGNFLYSAATAHSTMDYSSSKIQEGVVDSPPNRAIPLPVNLPSPKRTSMKGDPFDDKFRDTNGSQRSLYGNPSTSRFPEGQNVGNYSHHSI